MKYSLFPKAKIPLPHGGVHSIDPEWVLDCNLRINTLRPFEFAPTTLALFDETAKRINLTPGLGRTFAQEARGIFDGQLTESVFPLDWGWCSLLVASGLPLMRERHRMQGVPAPITVATAGDLARWVKSFSEGTSPLEKFPLSWFRNHLHRGLLEIGRLQFVPGKFFADCRIYTKRGSEVVALADAGIRCSADGWLGGESFETEWRASQSEVVAHPVDLATGQIKMLPVTLNLKDWDLRLSKGDPILEVHIPAGDPLESSLCTQAFEQAELLFENTLPQHAWRAFSCTSWMLDRQVHGCLPRSSGIVAFGKRFEALPARESESRQFLERVFHKNDWRTFTGRTSLQRAAQAHLRRGGLFRTTSGFILRRNRGLEDARSALPSPCQLKAL